MVKNEFAEERILEVGAAYGYFADAMSELIPNLHITCVEPTPKLAQILRNKGYVTIEKGYGGNPVGRKIFYDFGV